MTEILNEIRKIPPVTRFLCASMFAVTLSERLNIVSPYRLLFVRELVTNNWEFWRVYTSFFLGGSGLRLIIDSIMLYRNSNDVESYYSRRSADYAWQLLISAVAILGFNIPLRTFVHLRPLLVSLTYLSSRLAPPGTQTSLMGLITLPVIYLPYSIIAIDLIIGGPAEACCSLTGLLAGHLWWWGVWDTRVLERIGQAPTWLKTFIGNDAAPAIPRGSGVHVIPPRAREPVQQRSTGYSWGSGQRLGGS